MKEEYIIINKTAIQKRIEELEKEIKFLTAKDAYGDIGKLSAYKQILSQSSPLIPEIEKAFEAGKDYEFDCQTTLRKTGMSDGTSEYPNTKDYISNLKFNI